MKKIKMSAILALAVFGLASNANAADAVVGQETAVAAPEYSSPFTWTGFYLGAQGGYDWKKSVWSTNAFGPTNAGDSRANGWFGGAYAGYNHQFNNRLVLGGEADFNIGGLAIKGDLGVNGRPVPGSEIRGKVDFSGAARARVGYSFDQFMPYLAGGVAFAKTRAVVIAPNGSEQRLNDTRVGWTVGGGAEYAITDNFIARAEYRYTDFGKTKFSIGNFLENSSTLKGHDIRLGVGYKF